MCRMTRKKARRMLHKGICVRVSYLFLSHKGHINETSSSYGCNMKEKKKMTYLPYHAQRWE